MQRPQERLIRFLRWTEKYTKTDMVYLAGAGFWTNLNFVIVSVFTLLLSIAYANLLPADVFGLYQFFLSISAIITALTLAGMNTAVSQAVARGYEGVLRESVRIQLRWSVVPFALGACGALYYAFNGNLAVALGIGFISVLSPLGNAFNTYSAYLNGKREFRRAFIYSSLINAMYFSSIFLTVAFLKNAVALVVVNLGSNTLVYALLYYRTLRRYQPNDQSDPEAISYGKHLSVMNAFGTIVTQLDSVLVFHYLGAVNLAIYTFATTIPERVAGLSKFVSVAALPKFSTQSADAIRANILSKMLRAGIAAAVLCAAFVVCLSLIFHLLFPKYVVAIPYAQFYSLVIITTAVANISVTALLAQRKQGDLYIYNFTNPIVLFALQWPLLVYFGIWGILTAKIASNAFNIVISTLLLFRRDREGISSQSEPSARGNSLPSPASPRE